MGQVMCAICDGDGGRKVAIDRLLAQGESARRIARRMEDLDWPTSHDAVNEHRRHWLNTLPTDDEDVMRKVTGNPGRNGTAKPDVATLVRDEVARLLDDGELTPTIAHGLTAQAMIDRREERKQDRELMVGMARMLSGGGQSAPKQLIDADYERLPETIVPAGDTVRGRVPVPSRQAAHRTQAPPEGTE
jgi:hypothetical protein